MTNQGKKKWRSLKHALLLASFVSMLATGCAVTPAPVLPDPNAPVAAIPPQRMNLPQFLGLDVALSATVCAAQKTRAKVAERWPALQATSKHETTPVGDPEKLKSPSPTIAGAAAVQQAKASAPAKMQALAYLSTLDCGTFPQVEDAYLAALDDIDSEVRVAAIESLLASVENCSNCQDCCNSCCTLLLRQKLTKLAYDRKDNGCFCEPVAKVRRLARLALSSCGGPALAPPPIQPEELPNPSVVRMIQEPTEK